VYLLTNENVAGSYDIVLLNSKKIQTTDVNGVDIITETTITGSTFQLEIIFSENGNVLMDGEYVINNRVEVAGQLVSDDTSIVVIDSQESNYTTNNTSMTMVLAGKVYDVTVFNSNEIRLFIEEVSIENGDTVVSTDEIKMVRQ
jgi:hypothetical protein